MSVCVCNCLSVSSLSFPLMPIYPILNSYLVISLSLSWSVCFSFCLCLFISSLYFLSPSPSLFSLVLRRSPQTQSRGAGRDSRGQMIGCWFKRSIQGGRQRILRKRHPSVILPSLSQEISLPEIASATPSFPFLS